MTVGRPRASREVAPFSKSPRGRDDKADVDRGCEVS